MQNMIRVIATGGLNDSRHGGHGKICGLSGHQPLEGLYNKVNWKELTSAKQCEYTFKQTDQSVSKVTQTVH